MGEIEWRSCFITYRLAVLLTSVTRRDFSRAAHVNFDFQASTQIVWRLAVAASINVAMLIQSAVRKNMCCMCIKCLITPRNFNKFHHCIKIVRCLVATVTLRHQTISFNVSQLQPAPCITQWLHTHTNKKCTLI